MANYQRRLCWLLLTIAPFGCTRTCANGGESVSPRAAAAGGSRGADAPDGGSAPRAAAAGGAVCAAFATESPCETLLALIAASDQRADLRPCLDGGLAVSPLPPDNTSQVCSWVAPLMPAGKGGGWQGEGLPDCLLGDYVGNAITCDGDDALGTAHYDSFKKMATACLSGWKIENRETLPMDDPHWPGVAFERALPDGDREKVTRVHLCRHPRRLDPSVPQAMNEFVIDIFTAHRQRGATVFGSFEP